MFGFHPNMLSRCECVFEGERGLLVLIIRSLSPTLASETILGLAVGLSRSVARGSYSVNTHSVCSLGLWGVCLCALVLPCSTLAVLPVVMWASWTWKSVLQSLCVYCCECLDRILETPLSLAQWSLAPQRTAYCNLQYSLLFTVTFITFMHAGPDCAVIKSNSCDAGDNLTVFLYESELFPLIKQEWS